MKIYLKNQNDFSKEAIEFYKNNFQIVEEQEADILVVNDFAPMEDSGKIVARNSTAEDGIIAKEIISLRGEDLSDLTAVPELCLGMVIYLTRIFKREEIRGKMLGIIGYGRIGRKFEEMAEKMKMKVVWYDNNDEMVFGRKNRRELNDLLKKSDIVSLHITADESNRNFIKKEHFEKMKQGTIFLNSARSWLVNQQDLKDALDNGKLVGTWEDFEGFEHPKMIRTPHLGGGTKESRKKSELILANKILRYVNTAR
jgi:phosphoglycerate dehydrogenase-like enzyme